MLENRSNERVMKMVSGTLFHQSLGFPLTQERIGVYPMKLTSQSSLGGSSGAKQIGHCSRSKISP